MVQAHHITPSQSKMKISVVARTGAQELNSSACFFCVLDFRWIKLSKILCRAEIYAILDNMTTAKRNVVRNILSMILTIQLRSHCSDSTSTSLNRFIFKK